MPGQTKAPSPPAAAERTITGRLVEAGFVAVLCGALGVAGSWVQAQNPLFGVPVDDPSSLVFIAVMAILGFVGMMVNSGRRPAPSPDALCDVDLPPDSRETGKRP